MPNLNDKFGIITLADVTMNLFSVFNRWGQLIFQTNDPNTKWDGTFKEVLCPIEVYVYLADVDCG